MTFFALPIRLLTGVFMAVAALALGTPAWSQAGPGKGETVRVQDYPGLGNMLVRVAMAKQYCEKYGIKCTVRQLPNGILGVQAFMAGELDVAYAAPEVMYQVITKGANVKLISGGYMAPPFFLAVSAGTETPNAAKGYPSAMADFKGKKIGVPARGSQGETVFTEMLIDAGLSEKDVTYVAVGGPPTAYAALVNKQIDAVMAFTPVDGFCEVAKTCRLVIDTRKGEGPKSIRDSIGSGAPMWMKADYITANPHVLQAMRRAMADAETFMKLPANFEELMGIVGVYFKVPGDQGDAIARASLRNNMANFGTSVKTEALQAVADYMLQNKQLPTRVNAASVIQP